MREKAAILDLAEPVWGNETPGNGTVSVETPGGAELVVIGTTEDIVAGSVLIKSSLRLPESVHFASKRYGSWKLLAGVDGFAAERKLSEAGWNFFFVVPEIRRSALSSNRSKALRRALKKIVSATEAQNFNALEIVESHDTTLPGATLHKGRRSPPAHQAQPVFARPRSLSCIAECLGF